MELVAETMFQPWWLSSRFFLRDMAASIFIGLILGTAMYVVYQQEGLLVFTPTHLTNTNTILCGLQVHHK
ncbi:hypothetical protein Holit_01502 [Hollandina sp. SP2]